MEGLYVVLSGGRRIEDTKRGEWGIDGPIIGPVNVSYARGMIKLHSLDYMEYEFIQIDKGCIMFDGVCYEEFNLIREDDDMWESVSEGRVILSIDNFK